MRFALISLEVAVASDRRRLSGTTRLRLSVIIATAALVEAEPDQEVSVRATVVVTTIGIGEISGLAVFHLLVALGEAQAEAAVAMTEMETTAMIWSATMS